MEPGENRIADLNGYLYRMQKSMIDKMFFIQKDFGMELKTPTHIKIILQRIKGE